MINKKNTQMAQSVYDNDLVISQFIKIVIIIFPFSIFMGPFINIFDIKISNLYSLVLCAVVLKNLLKMRLGNISGYVSFFFVMILYAYSSMIWGNYGDTGKLLIFPLITGFLAMVFVASLNEQEFKLFIKSLSIFTVVILTLSLIEIYTGKYIMFENVDFIYRTNVYQLHYPGVAFANPNDLAQYLLVGTPLLVFEIFERRRNVIIPIVLFILTIFVLLNADSRLAIISMVIIGVTYISSSMVSKGKRLIHLLLAVGAAIVIINALPYSGIELSVYNVFDMFKVDSSQGYFTARSDIYLNVLELGIDNVIFGAGLGASYAVSLLGTHNLFLFIFADLGLLFAAGFVVLLVKAFITVFKYRNIQVCGWHMGSVVLSILIIFPLFSSMSSGNEQRKIVWIALGIVFGVIKISETKYKLLKKKV